MTSVSSLGSSSQLTPLQLLQQELAREAATGTVSSTDQTALSSALTDIDTALKSDSGSQSSDSSSSPGDIKSKVSDLIANEVKNGKLTSDQATELQNVFDTTFAAGGPGGQGGPQGAGGPPPGPPPSGSPPSSDSSSSDSTSSTSDDAAKVLKDFLKLLQDSQSGSSTYSASGSASTTATSTDSLVLNFKA